LPIAVVWRASIGAVELGRNYRVNDDGARVDRSCVGAHRSRKCHPDAWNIIQAEMLERDGAGTVIRDGDSAPTALKDVYSHDGLLKIGD
jgi:hypothetical protein